MFHEYSLNPMQEVDDSYKQLASTDPVIGRLEQLIRCRILTVEQALRLGVVTLVNNRRGLLERLEKLTRIVPRRVKALDGRVYRWDAPDEFIEIE